EREGRGVAFVVLVVERHRPLFVKRPLETVECDVVIRRNLPAVTCRCIGEALRADDGELFQSGHAWTTPLVDRLRHSSAPWRSPRGNPLSFEPLRGEIGGQKPRASRGF